MGYKYFTYYVFEKGYPEQRQAKGKVIHYDEDQNIYVLEINLKGEKEQRVFLGDNLSNAPHLIQF